MSGDIFDYCDSCGGQIREETLLDQDRADQAKKALSKPFKISVPLEDYTALTEERNRLRRELAEADASNNATGERLNFWIDRARTFERELAEARNEIERFANELAESEDEIARADYATRRATEQLAEAKARMTKAANDITDIATDADLCDVVSQLREVARELRPPDSGCGMKERKS